MKKILSSLFKVLFKVLNVIALIVFMISVCALDSDTYFFYYSTAISFAWLIIAGYKSGIFGGECDEFDT